MKIILIKTFLLIIFIAALNSPRYAGARNWGERKSPYKRYDARHPRPPKPKIKHVRMPVGVIHRHPGDINQDGVVDQKDKAIHARIRQEKKYTASHDLNKDGKVDYQDKIIWVNNHSGSGKIIVVKQEEEDMLADIDVNNDGVIDQTDLNAWLSAYDLDENGEITAEELIEQKQ